MTGRLRTAEATHRVAPGRRAERASAEAEGGAAGSVASPIRARLPGLARNRACPRAGRRARIRRRTDPRSEGGIGAPVSALAHWFEDLGTGYCGRINAVLRIDKLAMILEKVLSQGGQGSDGRRGCQRKISLGVRAQSAPARSRRMSCVPSDQALKGNHWLDFTSLIESTRSQRLYTSFGSSTPVSKAFCNQASANLILEAGYSGNRHKSRKYLTLNIQSY